VKAKFKIGIVEDEVIIAQNLFELLSELGYDVAEPACNYEDGLELIKSTTLDLVILDIRLGKGPDGIALGKYLKEELNIPFIYLTANADGDTVYIANKTSPVAYLTKPFSKNDLIAAIEIASYKFVSRPVPVMEAGFVHIKNGDSVHKISIDDILYVESDHVHVKIYTDQNSYVHRSSLQQFLTDLNSADFVRTHRSYLVNLQHVTGFAKQHVKVGYYFVPLSRSYNSIIQYYHSKKD
jgi:DNA-binding LytR/AlgR family response regulator